MRKILYARNDKTVAIMSASCFEELQAMFRVGIQLPSGKLANSIGECTPDQWQKLSEKYTVENYAQ